MFVLSRQNPKFTESSNKLTGILRVGVMFCGIWHFFCVILLEYIFYNGPKVVRITKYMTYLTFLKPPLVKVMQTYMNKIYICFYFLRHKMYTFPLFVQ